jgi:hypothetical protein
LVAGVQGSGIALGIALTFGAMPAASQAYHGNWRAGMSWFAIVAIVGLVLCLLTLLGKEPEVPWERKLLTLLETSNWPCGNRHFIWVLPPCWALLGS